MLDASATTSVNGANRSAKPRPNVPAWRLTSFTSTMGPTTMNARRALNENWRDSFRVTMNNFLATGGDGFTVFNEGTDALGGAQDIDAFVAAFAAAEPAGIAVPPLDRIVSPSP